MECGCLRSKQFGAIDGTPVAPTEGTSAPHWLENSTELERDKTQEVRYIREIIEGKKRSRRFWEITTDAETMPDNSTWYVMTEIPGLKYQDVGNLYGCRNWVEYGLIQSKNELGWADFRLTRYQDIEKWWEIVFSAYLLVSLFAEPWENSKKNAAIVPGSKVREHLVEHPQWDEGIGWKNFRMGSPLN
jgi:SRSO17 transposase